MGIELKSYRVNNLNSVTLSFSPINRRKNL